MADDIITRLRELGGDWDHVGLVPGDDLREAADEIERLRHELGTIHADFAAIDELRNAGIERLHATITELRAEVQRLEQVTRG